MTKNITCGKDGVKNVLKIWTTNLGLKNTQNKSWTVLEYLDNPMDHR